MMPVSPLSKNKSASIQAQIDNKTKPIGALGLLEPLALQLALICQHRDELHHVGRDGSHFNDIPNVKVSLKKPTMLVFAGDHGINEANLSIAPSTVTKQMVLNFLQGGAAINCFCQSNSIDLTVVDCGVLAPLTESEVPVFEGENLLKASFIEQRLGAGSQDFSKAPAMTMEQLNQGFVFAEQLVNEKIKQGVEVLLLGEMGIANTSSAAALMSALTSFDVEQCVGRGTGISDEQLQKKIALIEQSLARVLMPKITAESFTTEQVLSVLAELGGFEIVQMVSAILTSATARVPVVIDGFIVSVAALVAARLDKNVVNYLIFSHVSQEKAHQILLDELLAQQSFTQQTCQPLLNLGLRLGEGTGAALALPLIQAAASFYNDMASFESAGVTV